jgi:CheY-like chemotaxis protein
MPKENPKTVLIVDDNAATNDVLREAFAAKGYRVVTALDAMEGASAAQKSRPDIAILDFSMPGGDGTVVYRSIRKLPEVGEIPIVFLTGSSKTSTVQAIADTDPKVRLLFKPVDLVGLLEFVAKFLDDTGRR